MIKVRDDSELETIFLPLINKINLLIFFFPVCYLLRAFNPFRLREYHVSLFIITFLLSFSLGFHSLSYLLFHLNILQEAV